MSKSEFTLTVTFICTRGTNTQPLDIYVVTGFIRVRKGVNIINKSGARGNWMFVLVLYHAVSSEAKFLYYKLKRVTILNDVFLIENHSLFN